MCTHKHPFDSQTLGGLYLKIIKGSYKPIPSTYSKELGDIISACLKKDGKDRPSIQDILENPKLQQEAAVLGYQIPTPRELEKEIQLQKKDFMSTFAKKKFKHKKAGAGLQVYTRSKTSTGNKKDPSSAIKKLSKYLVTNPTKSKNDSGKEKKVKADLISSEICDAVDSILNKSPRSRHEYRPSYLKYVRNPCSSKPNDSEISYEQNTKVNQTELKPSEFYGKVSRNYHGRKDIRRGNTTQDYGVLDENKPHKIDDSIYQAYQIIAAQRRQKQNGSNSGSRDSGSKKRHERHNRSKVRKSTTDDYDFDNDMFEGDRPNIKVNLPSQKPKHKKSEKDGSFNSRDKSGSTKSAKLTPNCSKYSDFLKEPQSECKPLSGRGKARSNIGNSRKNLNGLDGPEHGIKLDLSSFIDSTKESDGGSGKGRSKKAKMPKVSGHKHSHRASTEEFKGTKTSNSSDNKIALKYLPSADDNDDMYFETAEDVDEFDDAFDYTDNTFDVVEEED